MRWFTGLIVAVLGGGIIVASVCVGGTIGLLGLCGRLSDTSLKENRFQGMMFFIMAIAGLGCGLLLLRLGDFLMRSRDGVEG
jgi:hypothetical protein